MPDRKLAAGPNNSPGFWLHHAALAWHALVEHRLKELELTHSQFMVLSVIGWLSRTGDSPNQQEIANKAGIDRMLTSRLIRRLEEAGHVVRLADDSDARVMRVGLSPAGKEVVRQAVEIVRDIDETVFGEQPDAAQKQLEAIAQTCRAGRG